MTLQTYVLDTSALLDTWRFRMPIDIAPGVWENIDGLISGGRAIAPVDVLTELELKDDDLYQWAKRRKDGLFVDLDDEDMAAVKKLVNDPRFTGLVKNRPRRNRADPVVIAVALVRGYTVVTEEPDDGSPKKCRIPYVCHTLDVPCINFVGLIRAEGWQLR
jgi:hypothetical protein